ncbi:unnamed protein product [Ixodes persulcatus]
MSASVGLSPAYRASSVTALPAFFSLHFFLVFLLWTLSVCCLHLFEPSHKFPACLNLSQIFNTPVFVCVLVYVVVLGSIVILLLSVVFCFLDAFIFCLVASRAFYFFY